MKFRCIVADPPWPYKGSGPVGTGGRGKDFVKALPSPGSAVRYGSIRLETLAKLIIPSDKQAHLYLWTTNSFIVAAHDLAIKWGFEPKTILTWGKIQKGTSNKPSMKTGYYFRGATEHVIFAVKGSLRLVGEAKPTLFLSDRLPHSVKPEWFYNLCEEVSPGPRLELFARRKRVGWSSWGNEINSDLEISIEALG